MYSVLCIAFTSIAPEPSVHAGWRVAAGPAAREPSVYAGCGVVIRISLRGMSFAYRIKKEKKRCT